MFYTPSRRFLSTDLKSGLRLAYRACMAELRVLKVPKMGLFEHPDHGHGFSVFKTFLRKERTFYTPKRLKMSEELESGALLAVLKPILRNINFVEF